MTKQSKFGLYTGATVGFITPFVAKATGLLDKPFWEAVLIAFVASIILGGFAMLTIFLCRKAAG